MRRWGLALGGALLACLLPTGCTRTIDSPHPVAAVSVAPITAGQVGDLLSKNTQTGGDGNLFMSVTPERCAPVAREVDPPFIFDFHPAAHDGGHWTAAGGRPVYMEEMVGVYQSNYDAKAALAQAKSTVESCRDESIEIMAMHGERYTYTLQPGVDSGSPDILLWSFTADGWACDSALTAAHNAAIQISACSTVNGFDVLSLAKDALGRINTLANKTM